MRTLLHTSALALLAASPALTPLAVTAQTDDLVTQNLVALDEVLLSASLAPVEAGRSGASVAVIEAEALRKAGEGRVLASLDQVAGMNIRTNGPLGSPSTFSLRGASQAYVKVMVDGIDISDPSTTQVSAWLGSMTNGAFERIEVIKGSQSAIHGQSAIGGVIAITTPQATTEGRHQSADLELGSFGTAAADWSFAQKTGDTEAALSLGHLRSDGFSSVAGQPEADGFEATRLHFNLSHRLANGIKIGLSGLRIRERSEYDLSYHYPLQVGEAYRYDDFYNAVVIRDGLPVTLLAGLSDGVTPDEESWRQTNGLRAFAEVEALGFTHVIAASQLRSNRSYYENDIALIDDETYTGGIAAMQVTRSDYFGKREGLSWVGTGDLSGQLKASFGLETSRESYAQSGSYGASSGSVDQLGAFGELQWAATEALDLSLALRRDDHSDFGGATTGRVSMVYRLQPDLLLRAQAGTGYRAPSSYERYDQAYGNPALRPEESRSLDLGIEKRFTDQGYIRATAFWLTVDNLIDYDYATWRYAQVDGQSKRHGLELEGEWQLGGDLTLGGSWTWIDSTVSSGSAWSVAPPKSKLNLALGYQALDRLALGASLSHVSGRAEGLGDYTLAGLSGSYRLSEGASAYARVENLFDRDYQSVKGYNTSGRALYLGLKTAF